ncbi:MAG: hypothetical protein KHX03_01665 [Clostridium sp.]|nr:hypothetical protein [Clostridium sp.]
MLNTTKINLSKHVLKRYEPEINNGTYFFYNAENQKFYTANYQIGSIIDSLDGNFSIEEISDIIHQNNIHLNKADLESFLNDLFNELYLEGFVVELD